MIQQLDALRKSRANVEKNDVNVPFFISVFFLLLGLVIVLSNLTENKVDTFYLNSTLNFGIPPVVVFQLEVYYKVDRLLTGPTAQQKGKAARWYSNKTSLLYICVLSLIFMNVFSEMFYVITNQPTCIPLSCFVILKEAFQDACLFSWSSKSTE